MTRSSAAALIACSSRSANTATASRPSGLTAITPATFFLKPLIFTSFAPAGGRTMRACTMPGMRTSPGKRNFPNTFCSMSSRLIDLPTIV